MAPRHPRPTCLAPDAPSADIRIGYARCSTLIQELQSRLDALAKHGIERGKVFSEKISTRVRGRPQFEAALALARQIKAHAPHRRVIFTVYEMKRLGRDAAELTVLADHLTAHGLALEMLAGPLPGMYDTSGPGRLLFAFFAAMAETEWENIREFPVETAFPHNQDPSFPNGARGRCARGPALELRRMLRARRARLRSGGARARRRRRRRGRGRRCRRGRGGTGGGRGRGRCGGCGGRGLRGRQPPTSERTTSRRSACPSGHGTTTTAPSVSIRSWP
ncbi:recombinase family protein [Streptomyces sp. NPDC054958]